MKTVHVFLDVDMRLGHDGLFMHAKKKGVDLRVLDQGECVIFVNERRNRMKAMAPNGVVSYVRLLGSGGVKVESFDLFPQAVAPGSRMTFSKGLRERLIRAMGFEVSRPKSEEPAELVA